MKGEDLTSKYIINIKQGVVCVAVVKGKRNQSDVEYFDYAYKVVEHILNFFYQILELRKLIET